MADLLSNSVSGMLAFQRSLATTSHNVANANTEGFSRQEVDLVARLPERTGFGFVGTGVQVAGVERVFSEFLTTQLRDSTSSFSRAETLFSLNSRIDNLLADDQAGLAPRLEDFFNSTQDVADDPTSSAARRAMLGEAQSLVDRFHFLDQRLVDLSDGVTVQVNSLLTEVNSLATSIAELNGDIGVLAAAAGNPPNDLLDRRDLLITQLAERLAVTAIPQDDGSINVFVGSGQPLVLGEQASLLETVPNDFDPGAIEIAVNNGNTSITVTDLLTGGELGAVLEFREQVLEPTRNELGRVAIAIASAFNAQHQLGQDLNGVLGGLFFNAIDQTSPIVLQNSGNAGTGSVSAVVSDVGALTFSDYRIDFDGTDYTLTRLSDGVTTDIGALGFPGAGVTVDGVDITLDSGAIAAGDSFLIQPTRFGALDLNLEVTDTSRIAAAAPIRTAVSPTNTGRGEISAGVAVDSTLLDGDTYTVLPAELTPADPAAFGFTDDATTPDNLQHQLSINGTPLATVWGELDTPTLTDLATAINTATATTGVRAYEDGTNLFLVNTSPSGGAITVTEELLGASDAGDAVTGLFGSSLTGAVPGTSDTNTLSFDTQASGYVVIDSGGTIEASGAYNPATGATITFNGIEVELSGLPAIGDSFTVESNSGGVGDNRNALLLGELQNQTILVGGTVTFQDGYGQMVANVGIQTRQAEISSDALRAGLDQAVASRESVSGVNLDEEAANLVRFQQAFQAAAQVVTVANTVFQSLLGAVGR